MKIQVIGGGKGRAGCGCIIRQGETYYIEQLGKDHISVCKDHQSSAKPDGILEAHQLIKSSLTTEGASNENKGQAESVNQQVLRESTTEQKTASVS